MARDIKDMDILSFDFMQRAFFAGLIVAIICPAIGIFLVVRRQSMIGDGLGHIAFAGVTAGWILGYEPILSATVFTVVGAVAIERVRTLWADFADMILAIFFYSGMALAIVLASLKSAGGFNLSSFLFGSIMTVTKVDLYLVSALGLGVALTIYFFYRPFLYIAFDEASARVSGLPVNWLNVLLSVLTAITVAVAMRIVGILLVSALMVIPAAAALQWARTFRTALKISVAMAVVSVLLGLVVSYYLNIAPGGSIVLSATIIFVISFVVGNRQKKYAAPLADEGCTCGCEKIDCNH